MTPTAEAIEAQVIDLPARLDFAACEALVATFEKARGTPLRVQARDVEFLGALSAEILLRARADWQASETAFNVVEPSGDFLQGLALLGIPRNALIQEDIQ